MTTGLIRVTTDRTLTFDDLEFADFRVEDDTVTVKWADSGRVKTRNNRVFVVDVATGQDVGPVYQNWYAARLAAIKLNARAWEARRNAARARREVQQTVTGDYLAHLMPPAGSS